jgi:hypothetical protein
MSLDNFLLWDSLTNASMIVGASVDAADCTNIGLC